MLTIRIPQLIGLGGGGELDQYTERLLAHLAVHYPEDHARLGDEGLRRHVGVAIDTGARHRILGEGSVATLAELMLEFGDAFERSPDQAWARTILEHPRLPAPLKVQVVAERMRARSGGRKIVKVVVGQAQE
jgi:hypothetical protein